MSSGKNKDIDWSRYKEELVFVPLGGSSEIGMNLNLYHLNGQWIIVDCGIGFADEDIPGIDIVTPKVDFLTSNNIKPIAAFITHIHEDHIGGFAYLWHQLGAPKLYLTPLAKGLIASKFAECKINPARVDMVEISHQNYKFEVGPFKIETVGITHSVPEMKMLKIETPFGHIIHTGDWKLDPNPIAGDKTEMRRIKELGKEGVHSIVCDSTNVFNAGWSGSEGSLEKSLTKIIKGRKGKVVVATFASNIARLKTICEVAKQCQRKVVLCGFSLKRITKIAAQAGYDFGHDAFLTPKEASSVKDDDLMVLSTGCQGEHRAALARMASDTHPDFTLNENDTVLLSSKIIPGNEKKLFSIFNKLVEKDVEIITERDHNVHVSGHPNRDELKKLYSLLKPRFAIPVHGEPYHIFEHASLAKSDFGVEDAIRVKNGDAVIIKKDSIQKIGSVPHGRMCIDGNILRDHESFVIKSRARMQTSGLAYCMLVYSKSKQELSFEPVISLPGLLDDMEDKTIFQTIHQDLLRQINFIVEENGVINKENSLIKKVEQYIAKLCRDRLNKTPFVEITLKLVA